MSNHESTTSLLLTLFVLDALKREQDRFMVWTYRAVLVVQALRSLAFIGGWA